MKKTCKCIGILFLSLLICFTHINTIIAVNIFENAEKTFYIGSVINAGKDTGYSEYIQIDENDPHWQWSLGTFCINGYSRKLTDDAENPIILKNVGDEVTLRFDLHQDITCLNGNENLSIHGDENGYDVYFGVEKTNFGHGALIVRYTDYQNKKSDPIIYTDYLLASETSEACTEIVFHEEGDYEVALNYEVKKVNFDIFGWKPFPSYYNYRIFFKFSIRNGNCMIYPMDYITHQELTNMSFTENGFYLDLAQTRYLDIDIKKEILTEGAHGLIEDIRFNRPAKDGEIFLDEGIYTITAKNRYTNRETEKIIYVGSNEILKAYITTGLSISEIQSCMAMGGIINHDGTITMPETDEAITDENEQTSLNIGKITIFIVTIFLVEILIIIFSIFLKRKKRG